MADTVDDLSAPLGQKTERRKRRFRLPFTGMQALAALLGLFLLGFIGFALFNDNPLGGEPIAHVAIRQKPGEPKDASAASHEAGAKNEDKTEHGAKEETKAAGEKTITIIDGTSGKRQDVVIGGGTPEKAESENAAPPAMVTGMIFIIICCCGSVEVIGVIFETKYMESPMTIGKT